MRVYGKRKLDESNHAKSKWFKEASVTTGAREWHSLKLAYRQGVITPKLCYWMLKLWHK